MTEVETPDAPPGSAPPIHSAQTDGLAVAPELVSTVLCVGLNPAFQTTLHFDHFRPCRVNRAFRKCHSIGGKGQNFAMACEQYGCADQVTVLQFTGGVTGSYIEAVLSEKQIRQVNVEVERPTRTCTTVLCRTTNTMTELIEPSAQIDEGSRVTLEQIAANILDHAVGTKLQCMALCGTLPPGVTGDTYTAFALRKPPGVLLFMDAAQEVQVLETGQVDILKVNAEEAALIAGLPADSDVDLLTIGRELMRCFSLRVLAITNGPDEAFLFEVDAASSAVFCEPRLRRSRSSVGKAPPIPPAVPQISTPSAESLATREFESRTVVPSSPAALIGAAGAGLVPLPTSASLDAAGAPRRTSLASALRRTFSVSERRSARNSPQTPSFPAAEASGSASAPRSPGDLLMPSATAWQDRQIGSLGSADLFSSVEATASSRSSSAASLPRARSSVSSPSAAAGSNVGPVRVYRFSIPDIQTLLHGVDEHMLSASAAPRAPSSSSLPLPTLSAAPRWGRATAAAAPANSPAHPSAPLARPTPTVPQSMGLNPLGAGDTCSGVFVMAYLQSNKRDAVHAFRQGLAAASASCLMLDHTAHFDRRIMTLISDAITVSDVNHK